MILRDGGGHEVTREDVVGWAPRGWRPLVTQLVDDLETLGWDGVVLQVKEKYGGLRFYVTGAALRVPAIYDRIAVAEEQSERLCEVCGGPGEPVEIRYWVKTLCAPHADAVRSGKPAWQVAEELS